MNIKIIISKSEIEAIQKLINKLNEKRQERGDLMFADVSAPAQRLGAIVGLNSNNLLNLKELTKILIAVN